MAAAKIRADYEQLKAVAGRFGSQAQAARQTLQALQRQMEVLHAGDWIGQGATAFYQEMGDQVLPTLKRVAAALDSAQQTTLQISQIMAQAEADAAHVLRGDGARWDTVPVPSMAAGPAGPAPVSAAAGPGSGAATPQEIGAALRQTVENVRTAFGEEMAAAAATGVVQGIAGLPPVVQAAVVDALEQGASPAVNAAVVKALDDAPAIKAGVLRGHEEAAIDEELAPFSQGVRDLAKKSPTLRTQILQAKDKHFTFAGGAGSDTEARQHTITIEQGNSDAETVQHIAHEMGHVTSSRPDVVLPARGETRAEFVAKNVREQLLDEGDAQFNGAQVRAELRSAGGPDIGIAGVVHPPGDYLQSYDDYKSGAITKDIALFDMTNDFADEPISVPPHISHREAYTQRFEQYWDTKIEPFLPH
jgi:WXG100 family type VII secretion target